MFRTIIGGLIGGAFFGDAGMIIGAIIGYCCKSKQSRNINTQRNSNTERSTGGQVVNCPWCKQRVTVQHEGKWICPYCKEEFTFGEVSEDKLLRLCFSLYAKFSQLNGRVTNEHIDVIEDLIEMEYEFSGQERKSVINYFRAAKENDGSIEYFARELKKNIESNIERQEREEFCINLLRHLCLIGDRAGGIKFKEIQCIKVVGRIFEVNEIIIEKLLEQEKERKGKIYRYYEILNCPYGATFEVVKKNYKKLAREYHPDKIAGAEIPEYLKKHSYEKFREIQEAYDYIKNEKY